MTLYEILGIKADADAKAIKSAWRKKAQQAHPDKLNGDTRQFQEVQNAYEILSNPARRKLYDEQGLMDPAPMSLRELATHEFAGLFAKMLSQCDVQYTSILELMKDHLNGKLNEIKNANIEIGKVISRNNEFIKRLKSNGPENIFAQMAKTSTNNEKLKAAALKKTKELIKEMLLILEDYEYDIDEKPLGAWASQLSGWRITG